MSVWSSVRWPTYIRVSWLTAFDHGLDCGTPITTTEINHRARIHGTSAHSWNVVVDSSFQRRRTRGIRHSALSHPISAPLAREVITTSVHHLRWAVCRFFIPPTTYDYLLHSLQPFVGDIWVKMCYFHFASIGFCWVAKSFQLHLLPTKAVSFALVQIEYNRRVCLYI